MDISEPNESTQASTDCSSLVYENNILSLELDNHQDALVQFASLINELEDSLTSINASAFVNLRVNHEENISTNQRENLLRQGEIIKSRLRGYENTISRLESMAHDKNAKLAGMDVIVNRYKILLKEKEEEIQSLILIVEQRESDLQDMQEKWEETVDVVESQEEEISQGREEIISLKQEKEDLEEKLGSKENQKYCLLVAKKEHRIMSVNGDKIVLNQKSNNIKILSDHPKKSFQVKKRKQWTELIISNETLFWKDQNFLVISLSSKTVSN